MLGIKMKLLTAFHFQTNSEIEKINQELEQYLRFFIDYKQKNWLEQLALAEFIFNNKVYSVTKVFLFIVNYSRELRMGVDIRRKEKIEKVTEFVKRMKKVQEEAEVVLEKVQEEIKQQANRERKEVKK